MGDWPASRRAHHPLLHHRRRRGSCRRRPCSGAGRVWRRDDLRRLRRVCWEAARAGLLCRLRDDPHRRDAPAFARDGFPRRRWDDFPRATATLHHRARAVESRFRQGTDDLRHPKDAAQALMAPGHRSHRSGATRHWRGVAMGVKHHLLLPMVGRSFHPKGANRRHRPRAVKRSRHQTAGSHHRRHHRTDAKSFRLHRRRLHLANLRHLLHHVRHHHHHHDRHMPSQLQRTRRASLLPQRSREVVSAWL